MPVAKPRTPLVPTFDIVINGSPLMARVKPYVMSVVVDHDLALPGMFAIELAGADTQTNEIPWIDDQTLFSVGNVVEIKLGYDRGLETLIVGEITSLEPEFVFDRKPSLVVRGYDRRHRLQRGCKTRTYVQLKDSDIAAQIAREAKLTPQTTDSQVTHDYVVQTDQTDWDFLQERARRIHYEVVVQNKTLIFRPAANVESAIATLSFDDDLLEFYPRLASAGQISEVTVRGWNAKDKKAIVGRARNGDETSSMGGKQTGAALVEKQFGTSVDGNHYSVFNQAEADQLAKARFNELALTLVTGEGMCWGRTDLQPGKVIQLDGVGKRFSGQYYITSVVHRYICSESYHTHFTVRRTAS